MLPRYEAMLAVTWPRPFDDDQWWFELKWDGYRVLVEWDGALRLRSRRGNDLTGSFPELAGLTLDRPTVIDAEVVVLDSDGAPSFSRLQQRNNLAGAAARERARQHPANLVVFDLLHHGEPVVDLPIEERRARLAGLELPGTVVPEPVRGEGRALYSAVRVRGLEGIVAKRAASPYRPGRRSPDWRKIPYRRIVRAVVGGYLPGEGARSASFGSLAVGMYDDGGLRYVGSVGSGFDDQTLALIRRGLDELARPTPPFADTAAIPHGVVWVEPGLVARVEYKEWTPDGRLRAPVFKGLAMDPPESVTWAEEGPAERESRP